MRPRRSAIDGSTLRYQIKLLLLALQFFTRVPIVGALAQWVGYSPEMLRASARFFPLIGLLIGGAAGVSFWLCAQLFSPWIAASSTLYFWRPTSTKRQQVSVCDTPLSLGGSG